MKVLCLLAFAGLSAVWAQTAPVAPAQGIPAAPAVPNLPGDTVLAILGDGTKFTMADFLNVYNSLPPANQQMALRNRETWIHQWELMRKLTKQAEEAKLDQESPYKEAIAFARMNVLASAQVNAGINKIVGTRRGREVL